MMIRNQTGALALALLLTHLPLPGSAQAPAPQAQPQSQPQAQTAAPPRRSLPAASTTEHLLALPDRPGGQLAFRATAGSIAMTDGEGRIDGEMAYIAYVRPPADGRQRPVLFAMNGGPGSASAWVHLGFLGPWRLPMDADALRPSAPPVLEPNLETWLDFTDLVFIDPIGTGFSRSVDGEARDQRQQSAERGGRNRFWTLDGDIESIAEFIRLWTSENGRFASPKLFLGESYGGFRGPRLANALHGRGVGLASLILLSPVLDFGLREGRSPLGSALTLPSLAAAAIEAKGGTPDRAALAEAEAYARGDYLVDVMRGPRDAAALDRISNRVADLTGIPVTQVKRYGGRIDSRVYRLETNRITGRIASPYDVSVLGAAPDPSAIIPDGRDPFTSALTAPVTAAMLDLYWSKLGWKPSGTYRLAGNVQGNWFSGQRLSPPESVGDLRSALALDPRLEVLVAHGFTDTVTPYFASQLVVDQLPAPEAASRVRLIVYPGGHMFYNRELSRKQFRAEGRALVERAADGPSTR